MITPTKNINFNYTIVNKQKNLSVVTSPAFKGTNEYNTELPNYNSSANRISNIEYIDFSKTDKKLDKVYKKYQKQLHEMSKDDIQKVVDSLKTDKNAFSEEEILSGMQNLTQFGNMRSIKRIYKILKENRIDSIVNNGIMTAFNPSKTDGLKNNFGLNTSLNYLIIKKLKINFLYGDKQAIFLDNNKLKQLEELNKNHPKRMQALQQNKDLKFFILSGWDNGINFLNRTKDLGNATKQLILQSRENKLSTEEALDRDTINRAQSLGLEPIIITNKPTEKSIDAIYKQLRPEQISEQELNDTCNSVIATNFHSENVRNKLKVKDKLTNYLDDKLEVYTPERMAIKLKNLHKSIKIFAESKGKTVNDIMYYIPFNGKSYDLINHQYQLVNNIPTNRFIFNEGRQLKINDSKFNNKIIAIIDDCSLSGESMTNAMENIDALNYIISSKDMKSKNINMVFAAMHGSETADKEVTELIKTCHRENEDCFIKMNKKHISIMSPKYNSPMLNSVLGYSGYGHEKDCIIFPYMCPDNDTTFAESIGDYHDISFIKDENTDVLPPKVEQSAITADPSDKLYKDNATKTTEEIKPKSKFSFKNLKNRISEYFNKKGIKLLNKFIKNANHNKKIYF